MDNTDRVNHKNYWEYLPWMELMGIFEWSWFGWLVFGINCGCRLPIRSLDTETLGGDCKFGLLLPKAPNPKGLLWPTKPLLPCEKTSKRHKKLLVMLCKIPTSMLKNKNFKKCNRLYFIVHTEIWNTFQYEVQ